MNNNDNKRNFLITGVLMIVIISIITSILFSLESGDGDTDLVANNFILILTLMLLVSILMLFLSIIFQWGPFKDDKIRLSKEDGPILLLLIAMFFIGFLIQPSLYLPKASPNLDVLGLIFLMIPILIIIFMLLNYQKAIKNKHLTIISEEE